MNLPSDSIILAIESAINGGSLALFRDDVLIDEMTGASGVSRAEDMLPNIDILLSKNGMRAENIRKLIVSAGPGSFTGIRIGLATAQGLTAASKATLHSVSVLEAVAHAGKVGASITCALPVGRDTICQQHFGPDLRPASMPMPISVDDFVALVLNNLGEKFAVNGSLAIEHFADRPENLVNIGDSLAVYLGRYGDQIAGTPPLFIGKQK